MVLDASAVVELVMWSERGRRVGTIVERDWSLHVPELMMVEVAHVLRGLVAQGTCASADGALYVESARLLPAERHGHDNLVKRAFELRHNLTTYDAMYVALAEALGATLVTFDRRLAAAPGHNATIVVP